MPSLNLESSGVQTLPAWLRARAERDADAVALRHKRCGLWRSETWQQLEASVQALANGLRARGFLPGDLLLMDAAPVVESFRLALAAHWLGGAVVARELGAPPLADTEAARFAFVGGDDARQLGEAPGDRALALGIALDRADLSERAGPWLALEELDRADASGASLAPMASSTSVALLRPPADAAPAADGSTPETERPPERVTHWDLVQDARALLASGSVRAGQVALAAREAPLGTQLARVLGPWLVAGLTLCFVETAETEDADRRELGPHVVFGRADGYADLVARATQALPRGDGLWPRWLSRALDGRGATGAIARRLIVSRLREVVGFGRLERAVVVDSGAAGRAGFQRLFGVAPFEWPARAGSSPEAAEAPASGALPAVSLLGGLAAGSQTDLA